MLRNLVIAALLALLLVLAGAELAGYGYMGRGVPQW